ncbi:glycoside hydrolase family 71/99 protein [Klebsiella variicola]|uniref:hypothetical protein n=1 Tax=Klebsiella variicola TaxID=244366 RepID=UPI0018D4F51F|nr:hypothetical protein [Klebsiella variicola]
MKDIYFVASTGYDKNNNLIYKYPPNSYDAVSAYNYHIGISNGSPQKDSYSYQELIAGYKYTWNKILSDSDLPYILYLYRRDGIGDLGEAAFLLSMICHMVILRNSEKMLSEAKEEIKLHQDKALNNIIICCWNEYGEGSYIEPSKKIWV